MDLEVKKYFEEQQKYNVPIFSLHLKNKLSVAHKNLGMFALHYSTYFDSDDATNDVLLSIATGAARYLHNTNSNLYIDLISYKTLRQCLLDSYTERLFDKEMIAVVEDILDAYSTHMLRCSSSFMIEKLTETNEVTLFDGV